MEKDLIIKEVLAIREKKVERDSILTLNLKELKIIALSDVHLGYKRSGKDDEKCDFEAFKSFLEAIVKGNDPRTAGCNKLIFCGDIYDFWRNDIVELLESTECKAILTLFIRFLEKKGTQIHFISGNHDYWIRGIHKGKFSFNFDFALEFKIDFLDFFNYKNLLKLEDYFDSRIFFHKNLVLRDNTDPNYEIYLLHGDEFDFAEKLGGLTEPAYDALCFSTDASGEIADRVWKVIVSTTGWFRKLYHYTIGRIIKHFKWKNTYNIPPSQRAKLDEISIDIINFAEDRQINTLIFGHTHRPFIYEFQPNEKEEKKHYVLNTGSWVMNQKDLEGNLKRHNTYALIEGYDVTLNEYTQRIEDAITRFPKELREPRIHKQDIRSQYLLRRE